MWINFSSNAKFAIKIYVGDVDVVSGEPKNETGATRLRRLTQLANKSSIQDYVVTPQQLWIDGIATQEGMVSSVRSHAPWLRLLSRSPSDWSRRRWWPSVLRHPD